MTFLKLVSKSSAKLSLLSLSLSHKCDVKFYGVLRVHFTPGSTLAKRIEKSLKLNNIPIKIKIQEQVRTKLKHMTTNSRDPFMKVRCEREKCVTCAQGDFRVCWDRGTTYQMECRRCKEEGGRATYQWESARSVFRRTSEHLKGPLCYVWPNSLHEFPPNYRSMYLSQTKSNFHQT